MTPIANIYWKEGNSLLLILYGAGLLVISQRDLFRQVCKTAVVVLFVACDHYFLMIYYSSTLSDRYIRRKSPYTWIPCAPEEHQLISG